ncbi:sorting nexin-19a [Chanos chanos]|uniref:Sorting nexin-19a n=1 Tax=Chanos chanos TaxID=29144 RepID=A0A6J2WX76_CHACN|nr:sorting nexin-19-like [Chanos chanos]
MSRPEGPGFHPWTLFELLGQRSIVGFGVLITWLILFHLLVNVWLLCVFTSLLVVLGGWLGSRAALDANSLLHLEHFLPLSEAPPPQTSESERRLDWEIHSAVEKAVRDFVSSWYRALLSEQEGEFETEVRDAMLAAAAELKRRARRVDRRLLAQRVLELCGCHLQSYIHARKLQEEASSVKPRQQEGLENEGGSPGFDLWTLYKEADTPHFALASPATELNYSKAVVNILLQVLVPYPHLETRTGRYMVCELITCNVLLPLVARVSNPDWLNLTIVDMFDRSTRPEDPADAKTPPSPPIGPPESNPKFQEHSLDPSASWDQRAAINAQMETSIPMLITKDSTESFFQTPYSSTETLQGGGLGHLYTDKADRDPVELLRSPYRTSRLYRHHDSDLDSPCTDRKISNETLEQSDLEEDKVESFCDCVSPTDFCGLVCLEEDSLGLLRKRFHPKVFVSEPRSRPESPVEDPSLGVSPQATNPGASGLCLNPYGFESLGSHEGPAVIQNLRISGTVSAKEQKGNSTHPYTLYTIKYETTADPDTDQPVGYHMVNRRYSEFLNLQTRLEERAELKKVIKNVKGPKKLFPDLPFGNPDTDKVETRKSQLESFLKKLCTIPETAQSEEVQEFLALNTDASRSFEKKPGGLRIDKMMENIVDTLKTAFPRSEPQSPTEETEPDMDGRATLDSRKIKSRLRFSSKIAPTLNVPDLQPKVLYCFREGSPVFRGLSVSGFESYVRAQEKLVDGIPEVNCVSHHHDDQEVQVDDRRPRITVLNVTDTALADVALNILCLLMKDQWSWLCTENIQKAIRLLFGTFIERWLDLGIAHLTSAPCWVLYLQVLQEAVWPGGELPAEPQPERSSGQQEETKQQCLQCLMSLLPEFIPDMLSPDKYRLSWELVLESLQNPDINRHLVYCIFDLLLEFLIPESSDKAFQRSLVHSLSRDVERTLT